jgi:DNA repair protein RecN (Recombination protein N)
LMIDALELALGERADTELVRTGATKATVQLVIDVSSRPDVVTKLAELGLDHEDHLVFINREVYAEGRSVARVNGRSVPISTLKSIGKSIVDLHGQHQHQSLLDSDAHGQYLDDWIGEPVLQLKAQVAEDYSSWSEANRKYESLKRGVREREQRLDILRFQVKEIEEFGLQVGEEEELFNTISRLKNSERINLAVATALESLADAEFNARDLSASGVKAAEEITRFDPTLEEVVQSLNEALLSLEEGIHAIRAYSDQIDNDPAMLDETVERLEGLKRLKRKYGESELEILQFLEKASQELSLLEDSESSEVSLSAEVRASHERLVGSCTLLTQGRVSKAHLFSESVRVHLSDLSMGKALFEVSISPCEATSSGADAIEFMFSANAGEDAKPLAKIASGGEISRVMLSLKSSLAGKAGVPTLIFDEVDSGLGGKAAAAVGKKLRQLGEHYQVIAISHLPQVASMASQHYRIEKVETDGRVATSVNQLGEADRVEEIARMLAGEMITDKSIANARELLQLL